MRCCPPGLWLASLRELGAPPDFIALSLPALAAQQQLEVLEVFGSNTFHAGREPDLVDLPRIVGWAQQHPSLQSLCLDSSHGRFPTVHAVIAAAQRARPALKVAFNTLINYISSN